MPQPSKIMLIRHGEKPTAKHQKPYGITADGVEDWESLIVQGWERAGALCTLFAPIHGPLPSPHLAKPTVIYASKPRGAGEPEDAEGSKSNRPLQTITPLAAKLDLAPKLDFGKDQEKDLAAKVLQQSGVVLICWQHERINAIVDHLFEGTQKPGGIPSAWPGHRFDVVWVLDPPAGGAGRWSFVQVPQNLIKGDLDSGIA